MTIRSNWCAAWMIRSAGADRDARVRGDARADERTGGGREVGIGARQRRVQIERDGRRPLIERDGAGQIAE
jgi:hypothetical protein